MIEIVFDVETTGLSANDGDRIVEIGAVEVENLIPTGRTFQSYVNPGRSVSEATVRITGITDEILADKPAFSDPSIVDELLEFIGDKRMVAHNAPFDRGFLNMELERIGRAPIPDERWVDTVVIARKKFPGSPASLDALCKRFNVNNESRTFHGALLDSQLLAEVYLELNGGRARNFNFSEEGGANQASGSNQKSAARQRPSPLGSRITEDEAARHLDFIKDLGGKDTVPAWLS